MYQAVAKRTGLFKQTSADEHCRKSQNAVTGVGDTIEWVHSLLNNFKIIFPAKYL